jgi:hypothetical protein
LGIVLLAFGFASTNVVFGSTVAASTGVTNDEQGLAGALVIAGRQIGSAVGVAELLSIVAIDASAHSSTARLGDGYRLALACAAGLAAAAAVLSLRIPRSRATQNESNAASVELRVTVQLPAAPPHCRKAAQDRAYALTSSTGRSRRQRRSGHGEPRGVSFTFAPRHRHAGD